MKKIISVILTLTILATCSMFAFARNTNTENDVIDIRKIDSENTKFNVSERMSRAEITEHYMKVTGASMNEAHEFFSLSTDKGPISYRILSVYLPVTKEYKPHIEFYCQTSESGQYWGIVSVCDYKLVETYNGMTNEFTGGLEMWLRSAYQIEYVINGDFHTDETPSRWYTYYYEHSTKAFQQ